MKDRSSILIILLTCGCLSGNAQLPTNEPDKSPVLLPNGWSLTPAGRSLPLGDLPLNIQYSSAAKLLAVTNNGQSNQSLQLINCESERITDEVAIARSWYGLQFSSDGTKLYVSGGNDNIILIYSVRDQKLTLSDTLRLGPAWPSKISPAGIAIDDRSNTLYTVTKENNKLYRVDLKSKKVIGQIDLGAEAYSCVLSHDRKTLYISLWGADEIAVFDVRSSLIVARIKTESHPNELVLNRKGTTLFVANANSNSVSVISTRGNKVTEIISTSLYPTRLTGSTTNGLALSPDEKTLFIANADNNCIAVFDISESGNSRSRGFIPTGWYPTSIKCIGKKIWVSNGKGFSSLPNPRGPQPVSKKDDSGFQKGSAEKKDVQYIGGLFKGTLSIIAAPSEERLRSYTAQVYRNTPFNPEKEKMADGQAGNPIPRKRGDPTPVRHVFYIIRENRTYDQVMGDIQKGNGDSSLCLFPEKVTPNAHALANEFGLLDNFYVDAEVSADGHNWSTAAYATDYVEKTWPTSYGGRGGTYDYEGSRKIAYPRDGFIWDYCMREGVTFRNYGEFTDGKKATLRSLQDHFCRGFPDFDLDIKDVHRFGLWKKDFDSLTALNAVPQFSTIRIPNDHTSGQKKGKYTPVAAVADNDLAIGLLVEHISHSKIWESSAIFILEDDAQNGPDHVDAHRSPLLVISPYSKRKKVISNLYSTSGVLRTMELILGLPPMSQFDAAATPLYDCFNDRPNLQPFQHLEPRVDLEARNVAVNQSSRRSELFDLSEEDEAPDLDLNEVVWKFVKGEESGMPAPRRSGFIQERVNK